MMKPFCEIKERRLDGGRKAPDVHTEEKRLWKKMKNSIDKRYEECYIKPTNLLGK